MHGDLLDLIRLATGARSLREALAEARRFLAQPLRRHQRPAPTPTIAPIAARNLWNRCQPIDGSHTAKPYLHAARYPIVAVSLRLRFHQRPALPFLDSGGWRRYPALVAAVAGDDGDVHGVHQNVARSPAPGEGSSLERPRKALGRIHGFAVRFGEPAAASMLLGGRGDRDGAIARHRPARRRVANRRSYPGRSPPPRSRPESLGTFVPPPMVSRLIVAQDRDAEGERAARRLQQRCTRLGIASAVLRSRRAGISTTISWSSSVPDTLARRRRSAGHFNLPGRVGAASPRIEEQ